MENPVCPSILQKEFVKENDNRDGISIDVYLELYKKKKESLELSENMDNMTFNKERAA